MQGEFVLKGRLKSDINDNWAIDGTPDFGVPLPVTEKVVKPSGIQ
jgi:hypothetical protein